MPDTARNRSIRAAGDPGAAGRAWLARDASRRRSRRGSPPTAVAELRRGADPLCGGRRAGRALRARRGGARDHLAAGGDEPVTIHRAEPGFWIGESALLARTTRLVVAGGGDRRRGCSACPRRAVRALVARAAGVLGGVLRAQPPQRDAVGHRARRGAGADARARASRGCCCGWPDADGRVVARQDELARLIGMTRSSLQRAMQGLTESGAVTSRLRLRRGARPLGAGGDQRRGLSGLHPRPRALCSRPASGGPAIGRAEIACTRPVEPEPDHAGGGKARM